MILWVSFLLFYFIIIWIKTGAISSFFHSDSSHQTIYKMKAFQKDKCHQAIVCAGLWVTPSSLSHSPPMWFGSSSDPISSVVEKRKEKMGHCTMTKGQSLNIQQLKKVWAPVVSNAQRKLVLAVCGCQGRQTDKAAQTPPASHSQGTCLRIQPDKRKWLKATDGEDMRAGGGLVFCITSI